MNPPRTSAGQMMNAFVISLKRETSRRKLMEAQLRAIDFPYEMYDAVDGRALSPAEVAGLYHDAAFRQVYGRSISRTELGCAVSHMNVLRIILEKHLPYALVLEDDALLGRDFPTVVARLPLEPERKEIILLTHVQKYTVRGARRLLKRTILARSVNAYCSHGYIVTRAAAELLLRERFPVHRLADDWDALGREKLLDIVCVVPYCIGHAPSARTSSIEEERQEAKKEKASPKSSFRKVLHRVFYRKFIYQLAVKPMLGIRKQPSTW